MDWMALNLMTLVHILLVCALLDRKEGDMVSKCDLGGWGGGMGGLQSQWFWQRAFSRDSTDTELTLLKWEETTERNTLYNK